MASVEDSIHARIENSKRVIEPKLHHIRENAPTKQQVLGFLTWATVGLTALTIGGITLTGGGILLALASPFLIFFSPILVPLAAFLAFSTTGILIAVGFALASISAIIWLYKYVRGEEPVYSDRVDAARNRIAGTAGDVKGWARDHVPHVHAAASA